jgi:phosphonate transport system ATP-binding protein
MSPSPAGALAKKAIEVSDLTVSFPDGTRALRGVSVSAPRGQFCVILGPSGSGKSTLLRSLNGLATASRGRIYLESVELNRHSLSVLRPRTAMIHQQFNLVTRATVAANVLSGALPAVATWRVLLQWYPKHYRDKACRLLQEVGLEPRHLHRRVSDLSGGQQQRVGIARAFMLDPLILLADEPVANLDPRTSRDILELLRKQSHQHHTTVLCSLHQVDLAREFADRIIALREGQVAYDGTPADLTDTILDRIYGVGSTTPTGIAHDTALSNPTSHSPHKSLAAATARP